MKNPLMKTVESVVLPFVESHSRFTRFRALPHLDEPRFRAKREAGIDNFLVIGS